MTQASLSNRAYVSRFVAAAEAMARLGRVVARDFKVPLLIDHSATRQLAGDACVTVAGAPWTLRATGDPEREFIEVTLTRPRANDWDGGSALPTLAEITHGGEFELVSDRDTLGVRCALAFDWDDGCVTERLGTLVTGAQFLRRDAEPRQLILPGVE
jgi:hypothetical protein